MVTELSVNIGANIEKILRDSDKSNVREFLGMVTQMSKLNHNKYIIDFLQSNLKKIGIITFKTLSKDDMQMFFDFVVLIFENFQQNRAIRKDCMQFLILGLSSKDIETRSRFVDLLNDEDRLSAKMSQRVKFILKELYSPEHEKHWLTTSANILLSLSKMSNTCDQLIFNKPLEGYVDQGMLHIGRKVNRIGNLSQPLMPLSLLGFSQDSMKMSQMGSQIQRSAINKTFTQMQREFSIPT